MEQRLRAALGSAGRETRMTWVAEGVEQPAEAAVALAAVLAEEAPGAAALGANAAEAVAEIAKDEVAREMLGESPDLIPALVAFLARKDLAPAARLQTLRAIGNLCFDAPANRTRLLKAGAVTHLADLLGTMVLEGPSVEEGSAEDSELVHRTRMTGSAAVMNVATDDEDVQKALVDAGIVSSLVWLLRNAASESERDFALKALTRFTDNQEALGDMGNREAVAHVVRALEAQDEDEAQETMEILRALCNADGSLHAFADMATLATLQRTSRREDCPAVAASAATTLAVALGDDGCLDLLFQKTSEASARTSLLDSFVAWMGAAQDPRLRVAGAIAIGNICRSDENAETLGAHPGVLACLLAMISPDSMPSVLHAALSSTKNLTRLPANRARLVDLGGIPAVVIAANDPQAPNQMHACGILRNFCAGQSPQVVADMALTEGLLPRIVHLSRSEEFGVAAEAARLLAAYVKLAKSSEVTKKLVVEEGGVTAFLRLVTQDKHAVLQAEAVLALVLVTVTSPECKMAVLDAGAVGAANGLLEKCQHPDILCNTLTLVAQLYKDGAVADADLRAKTLECIEKLAASQHAVDVVKRQASAALAEIKGLSLDR